MWGRSTIVGLSMERSFFMLKNYELLYILHPDLEGSSDKITEKVTGFITKAEGEVTGHEDWGKRKLAYKIAKNDFGVYVLINFTIPSVNLPQVEHDLGLSEEIMRFMVVALPEEVAKKPSKKEKAAKKAEAKKEEAPTVKTTKKKEDKVEAAEAVETVEAVEAVEGEKVKTVKKETASKKTAAKKSEKPADDAERLKKLDEKLEEILGE